MQLSNSVNAALTLALLACASLGPARHDSAAEQAASQSPQVPPPVASSLGKFSISLSVKDLAASQAFYEKLGFAAVGGVAQQGWLVLRNGITTIGLFQGHIPKNSLTFNPGWSWDNQPLESFTDVRELQRQLVAKGLKPDVSAEEASTGPAYFTLTDPDGNPVLIDQHVDKPVAR